MNAHERPAQRPSSLATLTRDIDGLAAIFEGWDEVTRGSAQAYGHAIEALNAEAIRRLVRALKSDPAAFAAMKAALSDEVVYAVLRRHGIVKPSLNERIEAALESVRPMLASHGGDVELAGVEPPVVEVRFTGACDGCAASALTFHAGVKKAVQDACPEITEIRQVKGLSQLSTGVNYISPFAVNAGGNWLPAGTLASIPEGGIRSFEADGNKLFLARTGNTVSCFQNACAHLGLPIAEGKIEDGIIACPYHGFQYDLASGECLTAPEVQLQVHAVRVINGRVEVRLSK